MVGLSRWTVFEKSSCFSLLGVLQFFAELFQLLNILIIEVLVLYKKEPLEAAVFYIGSDAFPSYNYQFLCQVNASNFRVGKFGKVFIIDRVDLIPVAHVKLHFLTSLSNLSGTF